MVPCHHIHKLWEVHSPRVVLVHLGNDVLQFLFSEVRVDLPQDFLEDLGADESLLLLVIDPAVEDWWPSDSLMIWIWLKIFPGNIEVCCASVSCEGSATLTPLQWGRAELIASRHHHYYTTWTLSAGQDRRSHDRPRHLQRSDHQPPGLRLHQWWGHRRERRRGGVHEVGGTW